MAELRFPRLQELGLSTKRNRVHKWVCMRELPLAEPPSSPASIESPERVRMPFGRGRQGRHEASQRHGRWSGPVWEGASGFGNCWFATSWSPQVSAGRGHCWSEGAGGTASGRWIREPEVVLCWSSWVSEVRGVWGVLSECVLAGVLRLEPPPVASGFANRTCPAPVFVGEWGVWGVLALAGVMRLERPAVVSGFASWMSSCAGIRAGVG
jgi:hypothetical protein